MNAGSGQLPLALRHSPDQRLDTFVDAPAGALDQLRALATQPGADWLYLAGPAGVGKTHLALAACAAADGAGRRAAYLPLASARGRLRDALDAFDGYDVVALDGVQAIAGARGDEVEIGR
ncbi:MAG: ATP-binding protein, partial [Lysobacteraceae bacterium]